MRLSNTEHLIELIRTLRSENGCPWDRKQTPESMAVYLIEEIFELSAAIESGDTDHIREELGDALFQLLFISMLYEETGQFGLEDASARITEKMIRRHPHVFGDASVSGTEDVRKNWEEIKKQERRDNGNQPSLTDSVPQGLPALIRAYRLSRRASDAGLIRRTTDEWLQETTQAWNHLIADMSAPDNSDMKEKIGELLLNLVHLAGSIHVHPETALNGALKQFEDRLKRM